MQCRIEKITNYKDRISVYNLDALAFLRTVVVRLPRGQNAFVYLDPPYYAKGDELYLNFYEHADHERLARYLRCGHHFKWVMSYDNVAAIRRLYDGFRQVRFGLTYTAFERRTGHELLICRNDIVLPRQFKPWIAARNVA